MFLCFDLGSSTSKVGLIDQQGRLLHSQRVGQSWTSRAIEDLWQTGMSLAHGYRQQLRAVCVSGCSPALLALDRHGQILSPLLCPQSLPREPSAFQPSGADPSLFLPLIQAHAQAQPQQHAAAALYLCPAAYLGYRLTGASVLPLPRMPLYRPWFWSPYTLENAGLSSSLLPPLGPFLEPVGQMRAKIQRQFGLSVSLPVFVIAVDFFSALIGCKAFNIGDLVDRTGTNEGLNLVVDQHYPPPSPASKLDYWPHPLAPLAIVSCQYPQIGQLFADYAHQQQLSYRQLVAGILQHPHQEDRAEWPLAQLMRGGHHFSPALDRSKIAALEPSQSERGRLIVDYLSLIFAQGLDRLQHYLAESGAVSGQRRRIRRVVLSGGQGHNRQWLAFKSWRSGQRIELPAVIDSELLGNAMVAAVGLGCHPDLVSAAKAMAADSTSHPDGH